MQFLTIVGLVTSLIIILSRGWGILWPKKFRELGLKIADERQWIHKATAVFLLVLGGLIFTSLALRLRLLEIVLAILFAVFIAAGILLLRFPEGYKKLVNELLTKLPDLGIRVICGAAVLFGIWLFWLAIVTKQMEAQ